MKILLFVKNNKLIRFMIILDFIKTLIWSVECTVIHILSNVLFIHEKPCLK